MQRQKENRPQGNGSVTHTGAGCSLPCMRYQLDTLETWSNLHELVRRVMGVHATAFIEEEKI